MYVLHDVSTARCFFYVKFKRQISFNLDKWHHEKFKLCLQIKYNCHLNKDKSQRKLLVHFLKIFLNQTMYEIKRLIVNC